MPLIKSLLLSLFLLLGSQGLYAKQKTDISFLLKADETTSFMNYEFHNLAYEAASKKDYENAFCVYSKLANKGDERAEYNVGMMYMNGVGVAKKKMDAYKWLRRASQHGNKEATLYFKQMNERYEKQHQKSLQKKKVTEKNGIKKTVKNDTPVRKDKNISSTNPSKSVIKSLPQAHQSTQKKEESSAMMYIIIALSVLASLGLALYFIKNSSSKKSQEPSVQNSAKYKSQMYDITYAHISNYHNELLKLVDMQKIKADKKKLQIYYMFIYGMIDYFCQLEKFTDTEQRRIFSTHMGAQEGKENVTAITQSILEGQRDHSMYHYQAAGGISARQWHEKKSKEALFMLKKVMTESRV